MGLLDIFKRKASAEQPLRKRLSSMKCKPVNYYAIKSEYVEAAFYSDDGHDENYVIFRLMKLDKPAAASGIYPVSKDILRKAYSKLGAVDF